MSQATFGTAGFGTPRTTNGVSALSAKPAAVFPGGVATDSNLTIAVNRLQTRLAAPLDNAATLMTVADASLIAANMQLSIDSEIVKTTAAPTGSQVPISRGFDGTPVSAHLSGAAVSGFIDAWHHNALVAEVEAIEAALGANLGNLQASQFVVNAPFIFPPRSPGGSLNVGANVITLTPVPAGINGTDTQHYLYISGGTGTAEAVPIIGGTAVSNAASGTVIVTCANAHSGAWTIQTATGGIQEAISSLPARGGIVLVVTDLTLWANVTDMGKTGVVVWRMPGINIVDNGVFKILYGFTLPYDRQYYFQNYAPTSAKLYGGTRFDMGGFPDAYRFGGNTIPATESLVGTISIPSNATRAGIHSGVAGYATTYYVDTTPLNANAVGVLGYAVVPIKNGAIWGSNFVISNAGNDVSGSLMFGCEIDVNHAAPSGPANSVLGCMIVNNCDTKPVQQFVGCSVRLGGTTNVEMTTAFESAIGAAANALLVGQRNPVPGAVSNSQFIHFDSCNGAINPAGVMWLDSNGNLFMGCNEPDTVNVNQGGGLRVKPRTFGTLPISPNLVEGIMCPITDCNTSTIGAVAGGGGAIHAMLYYNGTAWKVMCA